MSATPSLTPPRCRSCDAPLTRPFLDLGMLPLANRYRSLDQRDEMEPHYPLRVFHCPTCHLVQLECFQPPEHIFSDYAYFSSYSDSWVRHGERYAAAMIERLGLGPASQVVEIASNDGYLLQHFRARGIPVLGVEPAANVAEEALRRSIPTRREFFCERTARALALEGVRADLLVANNVLAHVPDLEDFVRGLPILLAPTGTATLEFHHLLRLLEEGQFDTIYHEHFSYFSLTTARSVLARHGLEVVDVEELPTHGGSLRVHAAHASSGREPRPGVAALLRREEEAGLLRPERYAQFGGAVEEVKRGLLEFLIRARRAKARIVGYGAPAKASVLVNYCGIGTDLVDYTVDRSPHKQGRFLPGTSIPILAPERIRETRPDYILVFAWNLREEILEQMSDARRWGARFVIPIPEVAVE